MIIAQGWNGVETSDFKFVESNRVKSAATKKHTMGESWEVRDLGNVTLGIPQYQ